ncbi:unnamed protein product, partial [Musa acuminata var. zebrina]
MRTPPVGSRATTTKGFQREWEKRQILSVDQIMLIKSFIINCKINLPVDHVLQNLIANRWLRLSDVGTNSLSCTPPHERASDGCYGNEDEYTDDEDTNREDEDEDDYTDDKDSDEGRDLGKGVDYDETFSPIVNSGEAVEFLEANSGHCVVIRGHEVRATISEEPECRPRLWRWDDCIDLYDGEDACSPNSFRGFYIESLDDDDDDESEEEKVEEGGNLGLDDAEEEEEAEEE